MVGVYPQTQQQALFGVTFKFVYQLGCIANLIRRPHGADWVALITHYSYQLEWGSGENDH